MLAAAFPIVPLLIVVCIAVVAVCVTVCVVTVWELEPWWRKTPKPKKLVKDAKQRVKAFRIEKLNPKAFDHPLEPVKEPPDPNA